MPFEVFSAFIGVCSTQHKEGRSEKDTGEKSDVANRGKADYSGIPFLPWQKCAHTKNGYHASDSVVGAIPIV